MSNNQIVKLYVNLDPEMTSQRSAPDTLKISDAKSSRCPTRLALLVYTGRKEATEL